MAALLQTTVGHLKPQFQVKQKAFASSPFRLVPIQCAASSSTCKRRYNLTLLPGDGIGPEIISVAKDVLQLAGSLEDKEVIANFLGIEFGFKEMPIGGSALDLTGVPLPEETLSAAKKSDAILLGAIGGYKWDTNPKHLKPETGLLQLRAGLEVFANLRPATVLPQLVHASTLKKEVAEGVDIMVIDRIARVAFEIARQRGSKLCSVDKANVLEASMLWRRRVEAIALEYPDVKLSHMYVDNAAMQLLRDPKQFDTIVTNNIFGDILSDEASMGPGVYEPIHGSAPDIAGQDKANPLATILSAAMLLRYGLQESEAADRIENAVLNTLDKGCRTGDIFSAGHRLVGCKEMGDEVMKSVESL
ncbi:hypothetical protein V2J09_005394 [Rumex salicifolius]